MTTLQFPDVSNYQAGFDLGDYPAAIAKATEGTTFTDRSYANFKLQALALRIPFAAYHWLHAFDIPGQARHAFAVVGPDVPLMIDDEDTRDGLDLDRTLAFVKAYRALGGTVTLEYLPRWFWASHGSPDLRPLAEAGLSLISSSYPPAGYTDNGPGWKPYGGVTPTIWQYTSTPHDMNAFKGTADQLAAVFAGTGGGDGMALSDADAQALIYRVEALINNRPAVAGGPTTGEVNQLRAELDDIKARIDAIETGGEVTLSPAGLAQVSGAAHDGAAGAIDGAVISSATISAKRP